MRLQTTDVMDLFEQQNQVVDPLFFSYGGDESFQGKVVCVPVFEDKVLVRQTPEMNGKCCALVVAGGRWFTQT